MNGMLLLRPLTIVLLLAVPAAAQEEVPDFMPDGVLASPIKPAPPSEYGRNPAPVRRSPPPGTPPRELNQGPVTGYGPGGLETPPGSPLNPPYLGRPFTIGH
jgi:hypothetical protein